MEIRRRHGFTLIEILIFVAIFSLIIGMFIVMLVSVLSVQSSQSASSEVAQQGQFLEQEIQYYVQGARLVDMPLDTPFGGLILREASSSQDPTMIFTSPGIVQSTSSLLYDATSVSATFASSVTLNNVLVMGITWEATNTAPFSGVTDNCGSGGSSDSYTLYNNYVVGEYNSMTMAYTIAGASGPCTITATFSQSTGRMQIIADELGGVNILNPVDNGQHELNYQYSAGTGANAVTSGNVTTTQSGDYIWGIGFNDGENGNAPGFFTSPGTGFTVTQSAQFAWTEGLTQTIPGSTAATFTNGLPYATYITGVIPFESGNLSSAFGSGQAYLRQGTTGIAQALTSNKVTVSNLSFTHHYNRNSISSAYGTDSISYSFVVSARSGSKTYSQTFQSSATVSVPVPKIALIQQAKAENNSGSSISSLSQIFPTNNESGDLLLAAVAYQGTGTSSIADTNGNTWIQVASATYPAYSDTVVLYAALNSKNGMNTTTVTFASGATYPSLFLYEYRGAATSTSFDVWGTQTQAVTTTPSSPSVNPTSTVELVVGIDDNAAPTTAAFSPGSGYTLETSSTAGNTTQVFMEDDNQYITGPVAAGWTSGILTSSTAMIATFK